MPAEAKDSVCLRFFDGEGMNLSRNDERKLEQLFSRDDFARAAVDQLGETVPASGLTDKYREYLGPQLQKA